MKGKRILTEARRLSLNGGALSQEGARLRQGNGQKCCLLGAEPTPGGCGMASRGMFLDVCLRVLHGVLNLCEQLYKILPSSCQEQGND